MKQGQEHLNQILESVEVDRTIAVHEHVQKAVYLAKVLQEQSSKHITTDEKQQQQQVAKMVKNADDKTILTKITDQSFRTTDNSRSVNQLVYILNAGKTPSFLTPTEKGLFWAFRHFAKYVPGLAMRGIKGAIYNQTKNVILAGEPHLLKPRLLDLKNQGIRVNLNKLGELLLGEEEAKERMKTYIDMLRSAEVEVISIKISTLYSQISLIAKEHTLKMLSERLEIIYKAALENEFTRLDGTKVKKFVYLDMEEYQDLEITAELFMTTLDKPHLYEANAGIVLQAYLPDSYAMQKRITDWSIKRMAKGAKPVTIRIVKGANLESERVLASIQDWELPQFKTKIETDANYKRMLQYGMAPAAIKAVKLGVASHNLFDISYALVLAQRSDAMSSVQFEMLEGMANHQRRALFDFTQNILLYAPSATKTGFLYAIGYLIRRLDENTGEENFLRHMFEMDLSGESWKKMEESFVKSFTLIQDLTEIPRRKQDRNLAPELTDDTEFNNEPDTDFSLLNNVEWAKGIVDKWVHVYGDKALEVPLQVAGCEIFEEREEAFSNDPSRPGIVVAKYRMGTEADVDKAVDCAISDPSGWRRKTTEERYKILQNVAYEIQTRRAELIGAAMAECGKLISEADPEVSEAIDFVNYYSRCSLYFESLSNVEASPIGVVAVVPPWNFPIAIPCGGIAAALAAGNTVVIKPASKAVLCSWVLCECFWKAGVPKEALQFVSGSGSVVGSNLVKRKEIGAVILTGGTETALKMLQLNPQINLLAETGGKNATIVTALSDRDQAIKNVIRSAFGHSGQKCSATSLLVLEEDVYNDELFKATLKDAVSSLKVGSAWELHTKINPLISAPQGDLKRGLEKLDKGEEWLVKPKMVDNNPNLWSPGVKWNVTPNSYSHMTEFFGPVLSVIKAKNLEEAIDIVNATGYGLTSGIETLDEREKEIWKQQIKAGNLYINRLTTGAIVLRQPFGGMGKSAFGSGLKAGGPNYLFQLYNFQEKHTDKANAKSTNHTNYKLPSGIFSEDVTKKVDNFIAEAEEQLKAEFFAEHDHFKLLGQDNIRRYIPVNRVMIRIDAKDILENILIRVVAAIMSGCKVTVSYPLDYDEDTLNTLKSLENAFNLKFRKQKNSEVVDCIKKHEIDRLRYGGSYVPEVVLSAIGDSGVSIVRRNVVANARVELLWYFMEQAISDNYHRYGNLGERLKEKRRELK